MKNGVFACAVVWTSLGSVAAAQRAVEEYAGDLRSGLPAVRREAAAALGRLARRSAVPALIAALKDPDKNVRREAAKALGAIRDPSAVPPLVDALQDSDANVRFYAAYALGEIKDRQAGGPLVQALTDPEWCVRDQVAWALREIGDRAVIGPLVARLKEKGADLAQLLWLITQLGGGQAVEPLAGLLKDPDAETRVRAVKVLGELDEAPPPSFSTPFPQGERRDRIAEVLLSALQDHEPMVRQFAVLALARHKSPLARKALKELAAREKDPGVRETAEKLLIDGSRRGDLVAHWSFDDRNAQIARDVTGRGSDGEIHGCTPVEGKIGAGLRFGKNTYIELGKPAAVSVAQKPITVMAWAKSESPNGVVVARGGAFCGFSLYIKDGLPRFGIHRQREGPTYVASGHEEVIGSWVHLAGVVRENHIELYVNGKLAGSAETGGYIPSNGGQGMEIGFDVGNSPAEITDHFEGILDEIKVFAAALSAEEIAEQCQ